MTNYEYVLGDITKRLFQDIYKIGDNRIRHHYLMDFYRAIDGLEKVSNKEYKIHIKTGKNTLFLVNGSKVIIKCIGQTVEQRIDIESIDITKTNESYQIIPVIKLTTKLSGRSMYLIPNYYDLITGDIITIKLHEDIDDSTCGGIDIILTDLLEIS